MASISLQLTADGSYTLQREPEQETYHSRHGAVQESNEVFLCNSGVQQRLQQGHFTNVLEIGFGSGLNFLLTAYCARANYCRLSYTGVELYPPPSHLTRTLLARNTQDCESEIERLAAIYDGTSEPTPTAINSMCDLSLQLRDALHVDFPTSTFHAVYLDAFSQQESPDLWRNPFLQKLYNALLPGGTLATYSVNRRFKDALTEAGFHWNKLPGPPGKRQVIVATR